MTTAYHIEVWRKAMADAEGEVMRATTVPTGGRRKEEDLIDYVNRARKIQDAAIARWLTAKAEFESAQSGVRIPE